jgi:CubicO group peptidase (beta-lactamase class C family)
LRTEKVSQNMTTRLPVFVIVLAMGAFAARVDADTLPRATPESVGMSSPRLQRIAQAFRADIERGQLPGSVIAIARKGKLIYYEAFGFLDKAAGIPMPKDAMFAIASMTKPLVAVGALTLYEENRLLIHDPVATYLPQLRDMRVAVVRQDQTGGTIIETEPAHRQPTVQDLMRHTSGLTYGNQGTTELHRRYPSSGNAAAETQTGTQFLEALGKLPLHYQPGTMWDYSLGLDVLGLAIEAVTKQPLGQYMRARVFEPLGMTDTTFTVPIEKAGRLAKVLPVDPVSGQPQATRDQTRPLKFECGGGCAASTALDYLRFAQMLLNRGSLGDDRILGRKTVEYMTADHLGPAVNIDRLRNFSSEHIDGYGFGLGVAVRRAYGVAGVMGSPGDYHWAGSQGTYFWVDPREELAVVFMAQTPGAMRTHYRQVIPALVLQAIVD